jgi:hypothetical protein
MSGERAHDDPPIDQQPAGAHDIDPEYPRDDHARDRWLRENVPPHHR